jgi:glycosyltransferase involved in cell wall biosynthesis
MIVSPWPSIFSMAGGGTPLGRDLVDTLIAAGYDVDYVAPRAHQGDWIPDRRGLRVHRFGTTRLRVGGRLGRVVAWFDWLIRIAMCVFAAARMNGRPRLIYAFSALTIPAAFCCGRVLRRPTIGGLFGTFLYPDVKRSRGLLSHFEETIAFKCPVDRLVILNDGTRGDAVARELGVPPSRVRFWMHGLDFESCSAALAADGRAELGLPAGVPLIVCANRLAAWKHVDRMLRAAPWVLEAKPDTLFVVAGDGPERTALEALAEDLAIGHSVRFLGALPHDVNLRLIASTDVFCALYDYSCVGVALLEALGCGVAVVVADTGATRDFVEDGESGLVVCPGDDRETATAIKRLVSDDDLRKRLGLEARRRALERFLTLERRASLELETIAELVS